MTALTFPGAIELYRLHVLRQALKLEMLGIKRSSRGPTAYSLLKKAGFVGSREKVMASITKFLKAANESN